MATSLKVAIVGAGAVGQTLGRQLVKNNAAVVKYGTRDPTSDKNKKLVADQPSTTIDTIQASIAWADAVILATPSNTSTEAGVKELADSLLPAIKGKVLLDATNPISPYPNMEMDWSSGTSGGERLAAALPDTHVFKAFNTLGENLMQAPDGSTLTGQQLTLLFAGPGQGRDVAAKVIAGVGFKPVWVGGIRYSRNLEAIAELWIHLAVPNIGSSDQWGRSHHFQVLRKE